MKTSFVRSKATYFSVVCMCSSTTKTNSLWKDAKNLVTCPKTYWSWIHKDYAYSSQEGRAGIGADGFVNKKKNWFKQPKNITLNIQHRMTSLNTINNIKQVFKYWVNKLALEEGPEYFPGKIEVYFLQITKGISENGDS